LIRNDARFCRRQRAGVQGVTPLFAGFPEMGRHTTWCALAGLQFSEDGIADPPIDTPNALGEFARLVAVVGDNTRRRRIPLPWLIHIAGDVHNRSTP
jgi:hypothetical protein